VGVSPSDYHFFFSRSLARTPRRRPPRRTRFETEAEHIPRAHSPLTHTHTHCKCTLTVGLARILVLYCIHGMGFPSPGECLLHQRRARPGGALQPHHRQGGPLTAFSTALAPAHVSPDSRCSQASQSASSSQRRQTNKGRRCRALDTYFSMVRGRLKKGEATRRARGRARAEVGSRKRIQCSWSYKSTRGGGGSR